MRVAGRPSKEGRRKGRVSPVLSVLLRCRAGACRAPRRSLRSLLVLLAMALGLLPLRVRAASLEVSINGSQQFALYGQTFAVAKMSREGVLYLYSRDPLTILRKAPSATSSLISPSALPATALSQSVLDDFAVDSQGQFYIPLIWKDSSRAVHSGVFVLDVDGRYQRTVEFTVPAELRRIAVDGSGNLFALGVDARYYKGLTMDTSVLHKYNPFGVLGTAFSPQSIPMGGSGELDLRAKHDIDRGLLFIDGGLLYSILTESRVLRVFDLEGALVRQVSFSPPMSNTDRIWHLALLGRWYISCPLGAFRCRWIHGKQHPLPVRP